MDTRDTFPFSIQILLKFRVLILKLMRNGLKIRGRAPGGSEISKYLHEDFKNVTY